MHFVEEQCTLAACTIHSKNTIHTLYYTYYTVEECNILYLYFPHIEGEECILAATGPPHSTLVAQMPIAQLCASLAFALRKNCEKKRLKKVSI